MRGRGGSHPAPTSRGRGARGGGGGPIVSGARSHHHATSSSPVGVLTRRNEVSTPQFRGGVEVEESDPVYDNVREPVVLAPILTQFEFPPYIKALLKTNGVRHLLSDCVEYHDSHGLQQGRQMAPMVDWARMARDMRISTTLFAVADVDYFLQNLKELDNVQAVLVGSKPMWSAHLTLSGQFQQLHSFLLESVALFVVDTPHPSVPSTMEVFSAPQQHQHQHHEQPAQRQPPAPQRQAPAPQRHPPAPQRQAPAPKRQPAPAPPAAVDAVNTERQHQQQQQYQQVSPSSFASPTTLPPSSVSSSAPLVWLDMGDGQPHNEARASFILSRAGFKVQKKSRISERLMGDSDDFPTACIFFKYRSVADYKVIGQYVANGGIFIHVGERFPIEMEKKGFPKLQWSGRQDCYVGNAKIAPPGKPYFTGAEGSSWRTKRVWCRNVPASEALAIAVDDQNNQTYPTRSCMSIHMHGMGLYVHVGDVVLDGRPINMVRDIILRHIKLDSPEEEEEDERNERNDAVVDPVELPAPRSHADPTTTTTTTTTTAVTAPAPKSTPVSLDPVSVVVGVPAPRSSATTSTTSVAAATPKPAKQFASLIPVTGSVAAAAAAASSVAHPAFPTTLFPPVPPPQPKSGGAGRIVWLEMDLLGVGLADKLSSVGFAVKSDMWGMTRLLGTGARVPSACVYFSGVGGSIDFRAIGAYVHRGGVFVYVGDRKRAAVEREGFPRILWSDQKDQHGGYSRVTPLGTQILGTGYHDASWYSTRAWARNVPGDEAIMNGMDERSGKLAVPNVCSMALHQHGRGAYLFVGDTHLEGHSVDMIRSVIMTFSTAPPPPAPVVPQYQPHQQPVVKRCPIESLSTSDDDDDDDEAQNENEIEEEEEEEEEESYEDIDDDDEDDGDLEMYMRHAQQGDPIDPATAYGTAILNNNPEGAERAMMHACTAMGITPSEYWQDNN